MSALKLCVIVVVTVVLAATTSSSSSAPEVSTSPPPPPPQSNCSCEHVNFCGEITSKISWFSCVISIVLFFVPGKRVYDTQGQRTKSNLMFWWYLCLNCMSCFAWLAYSNPCEMSGSGYPVQWMAVAGVGINALFLFVYTEAVAHVEVKDKKRGTAIALNVVVLMVMSIASAEFNGWLGVGLGVLAQLFRMNATVYDQFNWLLFVASVGGGVNGLIWLHHPDLCIIRQYKIVSYIIAIIRATEAFKWCSPLISTTLWKMEEGAAEEPKQEGGAGVPNQGVGAGVPSQGGGAEERNHDN